MAIGQDLSTNSLAPKLLWVPEGNPRELSPEAPIGFLPGAEPPC